MAGEDEVLRLDADGSGFDETLLNADEYVQQLTESLATLAENAGDLSALDEEMATVADGAAQMAGGIDLASLSLSEFLAYMAEADAELGGVYEALLADSQGMDQLAASSATASESVVETGTAAEETGLEFESMLGPLTMIITAASLAGGALLGMGMSGQKGEALLRGMAGASQQDIQGLQQDALLLGETMDQASSGFYQVESAGYAGKDALEVFTDASKLAEGAGASQQDVMSATTAIMHDYNAAAGDVTHYTDLEAEAVLRGKQSMSDFASAIGPLASAGENVGLSFDQVAAAEATMTQINPHVAQDAQQLTGLFNTLSPTMGTTVSTAKKLGLAFDEQKYSSLDLLGKLQYLSDISGGTSTSAFKALTGGIHGSTAAIDLLKNNASSLIGNLDAMGHSTGATQQAFDQFENTVPAHLDKVGASFSIFATKFMDAIGPKVIPVIDHLSSAVSTMGDWILQHTDLLVPALGALAAVIGTVLVGAIVSFVIASWPVILILTAIGVVIGGIIYAFTHWGQIMNEVHTIMKNPVIEAVWHTLQSIGAFLVSTFTPVWHQLVSTFQTQLVPAWQNLVKAVQPAIPFFQLIGAIIGAILVVAIIMLISTIAGLVRGFGEMLPGIIRAVGGVIQVFSGFVQVFLGIVGFFVDLFTGHFDKLARDLGTIWGGIVEIFDGAWHVVTGLFLAALGFILGYISGFASTFLGSIANLGSMLGVKIPELISQIGDWFGKLPQMALQWATDMINNFANGIKDGAGKIGDAIKGIAGDIKSFLGFSLPEQGPLAESDQWMAHMIDNFARDIEANQGKIQAAMTGMTTQMAVTVQQPGNMPNPLSGGVPSGDGNNQTIILLTNIAQSLVQLVQQSKSGSTSNAPNVAFNAVQGSSISPQQFYQFIQSLSGGGYESNLLRGSY